MSTPVVGIVMGSDSDLDIMRAAADVLGEFGVETEMRVISAHRTPDDALAYARQAAGRGIRVIIAGAGGAAHLAGFMAGATPLPVVGVPVDATSLRGLDALLATVQMPPGVPVATVAVDGARNAGLMAARILGSADPEMRAAMEAFQARLADATHEKDSRVRSQF